jgi:hypothetical protein
VSTLHGAAALAYGTTPNYMTCITQDVESADPLDVALELIYDELLPRNRILYQIAD